MAPPSVQNKAQANADQYFNKHDTGNRSVYDADMYSVRSGSVRSAPLPRPSRSQYSFSQADDMDDEEMDENGYTNSLGLIGAKSKPDPGQPYLVSAGSLTKAHVIQTAYSRYETDIQRRQEA